MKRQISSAQTFLLKIVFTAFILLYSGAVPLAVFFSSGENRSLTLAILLFIFLFGCSAIIFWIVSRFMKVSVDDNFLYVSNYLKEISVPFSNIAEITEARRGRVRPVKIYLKTPSHFGSEITFIPKVRFSNFSSPHPVIDELKASVKIS